MKKYDVRIDLKLFATIEAKDEQELRNKYIDLLKVKYKLTDFDIDNVVIIDEKE